MEGEDGNWVISSSTLSEYNHMELLIYPIDEGLANKIIIFE